MSRKKRSFLERLTGVVDTDNEYYEDEYADSRDVDSNEDDGYYDDRDDELEAGQQDERGDWMEEGADEGELMVDVYQTDSDIVIQTMVAGVNPSDLDISISKEMVTIKGDREVPENVPEGDYFHNELYWGAFSRTILLPQEVEADEAEAKEKNGLLIIRLPRVDRERVKQLRVKSG